MVPAGRIDPRRSHMVGTLGWARPVPPPHSGPPCERHSDGLQRRVSSAGIGSRIVRIGRMVGNAALERGRTAASRLGIGDVGTDQRDASGWFPDVRGIKSPRAPGGVCEHLPAAGRDRRILSPTSDRGSGRRPVPGKRPTGSGDLRLGAFRVPFLS